MTEVTNTHMTMTAAGRGPGGGAADRSQVLRRALLELKAARAELAESRERSREPIAVVGMGCRFPGGVSDPAGFWDLLVSGGSGVVEVPRDRWAVDDFFDADPDAPGRTYSRHGGFVDGVREFDAGLFGVPPREAVRVDPQHRLMLEVAWAALEHAGIAPDSLRGSRAGVFVGMGGSDYERLTLSAGDVTGVDGYMAVGSAQNMAANRLSYALGLEGPSLVVDTACSSSLVAVHLAVQALRSGECEVALAAGVNLMLSPGTTIALSKGRMLSPEGRCKTFDAGADGYVRGEGCGVVVLRRLSEAQETRRRVWAVVRGTAVNQDGKSSGLTVPRASAQRRVVRQALEHADVSPADVGYVEAHGTGTALGDPIEVRALSAVLGQGRDPSRPVALGSVKTNIGHLEAAAGIAGLIKAVLVVHEGTIPPHLNLSEPNPFIAWDELPVTVPTQVTPWQEERRLAGVSSFGFGGTNAHIVLESPPAVSEPSPPRASGPVVVKVAGRGEKAMRESAARLASWVRGTPDVDMAGLAWAAGVGRAELPDRAAVVAGTVDELTTGLDAIAAGEAAPGVVAGRSAATGPPTVAFAVPETAAGLAGALAGLYDREPVITEVVDAVAAAIGPVSELPLSVLLDDGEEAAAALQDTAVAQPVLFTVAVALGRWWASVGVRPDMVLGHGAGAHAAAVLAGACSLEDGIHRAVNGAEDADLRPTDIDLLIDAPDGEATARGAELVVELGPGGGFQDAGAPDAGARRSLLEAAATAWTRGAPLDWAPLTGPRPAVAPVLPGYPFQRRAYWPEGADARRTLARSGPGGPALRPRIVRAATGETIGEVEVSLRRVPFLAEHRVHDRLVVPGVIFLELALRCGEEVFGGGPVQAQSLVVSRPLVLDDDATATVQVVVDRPASGTARARVFSREAEGEWREHFETVLHTEPAAEPPEGAAGDAAFAAAPARCTEQIEGEDFYPLAWHPLFRLGPSFRLVRGARRGPGAAAGTLTAPAPDAAGVAAGVRPELLLLDACIQLVAVAGLAGDGWDDRPVHLGTGYERMRVAITDLDGPLECTAVLRDAPDGSLIGDLRLHEAGGRLAAEIWGASFRPVTVSMLTRMVTGMVTGAEGRADRPSPGAPDPAALRAALAPERERVILGYLVGELAAILGLEPAETEPDVPIVDVADSLMIAELRTAIDRDLGVTVPMDALFDGLSLTALAAWTADELAAPAPETAPSPAKRRSRGGPKAKSVAEMVALAELDPSITPAAGPDAAAPEATLLTGATGFVGAFLLAELLDRREGEVRCLVRAQDDAQAMRRLMANLDTYGIDPGPHRSRIVPVVGDLAQPLLGLDEREFADLHSGIGDIVHCGGMVKWTYPYNGLEPANVAGTREVLRLATRGAARPVHFISTVGVFSSKEFDADVVTETDDLHSSGPLVVGYAQTKWVAERMVRFAHERGLPVTIHRINTGGHSRTGAFNRLDHLTLLLKGCIEAGIAPHEFAVMPVQPAPIDYVAAAVAELSNDPAHHGGTFHLVNERSMTWSELFDRVEEFGHPLERMPLDDWRRRVTGRNAGTMALLGLAPFLRETMDHARLPFSDSALTRAALHGTGVTCPPLDADLVHTFLNGFTNAGYVRPPTRRK